MRTKTTYAFRAGQAIDLDQIYTIQGLAGGDWWERTGDDLQEHRRDVDMDFSESLRVTRDISITVIVETPNAAFSGAATKPPKRDEG